MSRLPPWLKTRLGSGETYGAVRELTRGRGLNTVCTEARCPNAGECWSEGTATFMILGDTCPRACRFCSVAASALPPAPDPEEPARLAESVEALALKYAVVTTVCRDDLPDDHFVDVRRVDAAALKRGFRGDLPKLHRRERGQHA